MTQFADHLSSCLSVLAVSLIICLASVRLRPALKLDVRDGADTEAIQAVHSEPTPRLGGVGIYLALWLGGLLLPGAMREFFVLLLISTLPVFAAGLVEDAVGGVRPRTRLIAAALSSGAAIPLLGMVITRVDVPILDAAMGLLPVAIAFTIFTTSGVSNAFNLVDGLNGLASSAALLAVLGLSLVAYEAGLDDMLLVTLCVAAAILGFLILNYPFGKIFLGDAGAYSIGHILAWLAIAMMVLLPAFTTWAVLLIFFWPIADTLFAIHRRATAGLSANQPDRRHHHHLVLEFLLLSRVGRRWPHLANPAAALAMLPLMAAPVAAGVALWNDPVAAGMAVAGFAALFVISYRAGLLILGDPVRRGAVIRHIETQETMTSCRVKRRARALIRMIAMGSSRPRADQPALAPGVVGRAEQVQHARTR